MRPTRRQQEAIIRQTLARVPEQEAPVAVPATQLDANGTVLDVNAIADGDLLKRVGTTVVGVSPGAPGAHASTHQNGGADEISIAGLSGQAADPQPPIIGPGATQAVAGDDARLTNARTPTAHKTSHQNGGSDEIDVTGLSGLLGDAQTPAAHTHSSMADLPSAVISDTELATELANYPDFTDFNDHSARHENGGADEISVAGLSGLLADPQVAIPNWSRSFMLMGG